MSTGFASTAVAVLHVADTQFGKYHRFSRNGLTDADRDHDSLASRLLTDLEMMESRHGVKPDVVVVAGDLAEWALPAEYEAAYQFLVQLRSGLDLASERFVIVPGNHDVNRSICQGYFLTAVGYGDEPIQPYWPKWEPFAAMYAQFFGREFPRDEPWAFAEIPDLKLAIAGLNSTVADSHRDSDHYGWLGEHQLRWFARRLDRARREGWLRIGVLHHNPVRGPGRDDAHLHDVDQFIDLLAGNLHLTLHGHTHQTRIHALGPTALPVLAAGSIAVTATERPPEQANGYQLVQIPADDPTKVRVWARRYDPQRRRWVGNTDISEDGDQWYRDVPARLDDAHAVYAQAPRVPSEID